MTTGDVDFIAKAIRLSEGGFPAPNPRVGCVIVNNGKIVGTGFHAYAGGPHAEVVALARAKPDTNGATAYVTLEPCNHFGRTPPCSHSLLKAGIKRVVVAVPDHNPIAQGGAQYLRDHGVEVVLGVGTDAAIQANFYWHQAMRDQRAFVVGKIATSLDGRIALPNGESQWLTNEQSRHAAHRLRANCSAILIGWRTALMDRALLTVRGVKGLRNQPVRVVLDPAGRLTKDLPVFNPSARTIRFTYEPKWEIDRKLSPQNLPAQIARSLFQEGLTSVMVEGGPHTLSKFIEDNLVDELHVFHGNRVLFDGPMWCQGAAPETLSQSMQFCIHQVKRYGDDVHLTYRRSRD